MINIPTLKVGDKYISRFNNRTYEVFLLTQNGYHGFYYDGNKKQKFFCSRDNDISRDWNEFFQILPGNSQS